MNPLKFLISKINKPTDQTSLDLRSLYELYVGDFPAEGYLRDRKEKMLQGRKENFYKVFGNWDESEILQREAEISHEAWQKGIAEVTLERLLEPFYISQIDKLILTAATSAMARNPDYNFCNEHFSKARSLAMEKHVTLPYRVIHEVAEAYQVGVEKALEMAKGYATRQLTVSRIGDSRGSHSNRSREIETALDYCNSARNFASDIFALTGKVFDIEKRIEEDVSRYIARELKEQQITRVQ